MKRLFLLLLMAVLLGSVAPARAQVLMRGNLDYVTSLNRVRIYIEDITNFGPERTDRLRLRMFASKEHWREDRPGRLIAYSLFPRLYPGEDREDVVLSRPLRRPHDDDWYYVTLILEERMFDEERRAHWVIQDQVSFGQDYFYDESPFPWDW
jgi:hypothetical protein